MDLIPQGVEITSLTFKMPEDTTTYVTLGDDPRVYFAWICKPATVVVDSIFEGTFRSHMLDETAQRPLIVSVSDVPGPVTMGHLVRDRVNGAILRRVLAYIASGRGRWLLQFPKGASEINLLFGLRRHQGSDYILYAEVERKNALFIVKLKARRPDHGEGDLVRTFGFSSR
jgi:hypothetical protein